MRNAIVLSACVAIILVFGRAMSWASNSGPMGPSSQISMLKVTCPPQETVEELNLDPFYKKYLDLDGLAIVSSGKVNDYALKEAAYLIKRVLQNRPDVLEKLAENKARFVILAYDELLTQIPEYRDMKPSKFWDRRARGLGPNTERPAVSCGEENLLCFPGDPYHEENILIHELAHAIQDMGIKYIDPDLDARLEAAYEDAMAKGLWKDKYASINFREYWAEGVQSYFDDNRLPDHDHNHVNTRKELFEYDSALATLIKEQLGDIEWKYKKPSDRDKSNTEHLIGYDASSKPTFAWPAELIEWYRSYQQEQQKDQK